MTGDIFCDPADNPIISAYKCIGKGNECFDVNPLNDIDFTVDPPANGTTWGYIQTHNTTFWEIVQPPQVVDEHCFDWYMFTNATGELFVDFYWEVGTPVCLPYSERVWWCEFPDRCQTEHPIDGPVTFSNAGTTADGTTNTANLPPAWKIRRSIAVIDDIPPPEPMYIDCAMWSNTQNFVPGDFVCVDVLGNLQVYSCPGSNFEVDMATRMSCKTTAPDVTPTPWVHENPNFPADAHVEIHVFQPP